MREARGAFIRLKKTWKSTRISRKTKIGYTTVVIYQFCFVVRNVGK